MQASAPVIVFSDVDGILWNPRAASIQRAASAFERLADRRWSLVLCSSKTRAELEFIHQELGIREPFIAESGAAAFIPCGYLGLDVPNARDVAGYQVLEFGRPYADVVRILHDVAQRLGIDVIGFSDMSVEEVARDCGLPLLRARLAKLREYVEPYKLLGATAHAQIRLTKALQASRLYSASRGRYEYVGSVVDTSVPVTVLRSFYQRAFGSMLTLGLADAVADDRLLPMMDYRVIVQDDDTSSGAVDMGDWAEAIVEKVQEIQATAAACVARHSRNGARSATKLRP
jgi:mannosyl-3-phosphoglycerate phosphatase family protein